MARDAGSQRSCTPFAASAEARRARVADRNVVRGESFAIEVTPEHFDFIEGVWEAPDPAELEGAIISESS